VVVGAGSVGGVIAGRLGQYGVDVLMVARGSNAEALRSRGLTVRDPDGTTTVEVPVVTAAAEARLTTDDVLVFVTKTHQLAEALLQWVDQPVHDAAGEVIGTAGELLPVLTALNGVEAERLALRFFRQVYGVCVWLPAMRTEPGEVVLQIGPVSGVFIVGRYGAGGRDVLETVKADWEQATFHVHVVDDVMGWKHRKLLANLGNAVQALLGADADDDLHRQARDEARRVYDAAGITIPSSAEEKAWRGDHFDLRPVAGLDREIGGSSWQSLDRGSGDIETDYLNGEIVRLARAIGLEAPINEGLQRLARQAATDRRAPGSFTVDDVRALIAHR